MSWTKKRDKKTEMKNQQQQKWVENFMVTQLAVCTGAPGSICAIENAMFA